MSFTTNVQSFQTFLLILAGLAAGLGYLRWAKSNAAINTIALLNGEINALKLQNSRLEGDNRALTAKMDEQSARINEQAERVTNLTHMLQGIPAWSELSEKYQSLAAQIGPALEILDAHCREQGEMHAWLKEMHDRKAA